MGAETSEVILTFQEAWKKLEMVLLVGACILTVAFISRQHASMQRMVRARIEHNERRNR